MKKNYFIFMMSMIFMHTLISDCLAQKTTPLPPPLAAVGTYQMNRGGQRLQGTQYMKGNFTSTAVVKWKATLTVTAGGGEAEPAVGDIDNDGKNDVVCSINNGDLMVFDGATGANKWTKTGAGGQTSAVIADADGDGKMDLAIANGMMSLRDGVTGAIKWSYTPPNQGILGIASCPNVSDLEGDGKPEVIFINNNVCYCMNGATGTIKWQYSAGPPASGIGFTGNGTGPAIGDLNGDGILDVVASLMNGTGTTLAAIDGKTGTALWTKAGGSGATFNQPFPAIGDVDGDCKLDVVFNSSAINGQTGAVLWGNPAGAGAKFMVLADVDDDCVVEAVTSCAVYNAKTGVAKWTRSSCSLSGWFAPAPKVGDFDPASPGKEIITNSAYNVSNPLSLYNATTGALLWSFNMGAQNHTSEGVSVADVDNDGCVEIVVMPDCCNGSNTLMILDDAGNTANCGILASIDQVDFLHDSVSCLCQNFSDFSTKCTNSWNWSFPGGTPANSTAKDPGQVCYSTSGTYTATMIAQRNTCASTDTVMHSFVVTACSALPPVPIFTSSDTAFCNESGECIDFFDHSTGTPTTWTWRFPGAQPDTSTMQNPTGICYYNPGTYAVILIVSNAGGTDSSVVNPLIIFATGANLPTITLQGGDTLFCLTHEKAYQWYFNGSPIPGATDSFYVAKQNGDYNVYITDNNRCTRLGAGLTVTGLNSVNDLAGALPLEIYPNPAGTQFTIRNTDFNIKKIAIYNVLGEIVFGQTEIDHPKSDIIINSSSFANGVYIVELTSENRIYRAKVMKE